MTLEAKDYWLKSYIPIGNSAKKAAYVYRKVRSSWKKTDTSSGKLIA
jgi:hypothetical protein